jgi:hypothetical protein
MAQQKMMRESINDSPFESDQTALQRRFREQNLRSIVEFIKYYFGLCFSLFALCLEHGVP